MSATRGSPRGIPTSRAYWDLQAEKLLNRVFEPVETIDLDPKGGEAVAPGLAVAEPAEALPGSRWSSQDPQPVGPGSGSSRQRRARRPGGGSSAPHAGGSAPAARPEQNHSSRAWPSLPTPLLLLAVFAGAGLITATSGVLALSQWNRFQESLQQERNLLLVERLRSFGPAAQPAASPPPPTLSPPVQSRAAQGGPLDDSTLPPPPPSEPWIEELATLPQQQRTPPLLRVPLNPGLGRAASAPVPRRTPAGPVPLLVGVVAVPGKPGSAIFQMGGSTSTVAVGDTIGSSGWRLIASDVDSVQIEHQGEVRRISIGGGG